MKNDLYYYHILPKEEQQAYHAVYAGLSSLTSSFPVPRLPMGRLSELFFLVRLDHPEIFYAVSFSCRASADASSWEFLPEYMFPKKQILEQQQMMAARVAKLARGAEKLDALGREQYVHDFLCSSVRYDKLKKPYSHEIIGALGHGVAVCEGIAKSAKILCNALELPCIIAVSDAAPEKGIRYRHAWNIVTLGGTPYHLDATFDNTLSSPSSLRYDYFNLNDDRIYRDHEPALFPVPSCRDGRHDWFSAQKLAFSDEEKLRRRIAQAAKKKADFVFRYNGGYLTREVIERIFALVREEALARSLHPALAMNLPQAVFRISFPENASAEGLTYEQADRAEAEAEDASGS